MSEQSSSVREARNPWKVAVLTVAGAVVTLGAAMALATVLRETDSDEGATAAAQPPPRIVEDCNRYAAQATRDTGEVVKKGVLGGAIGAGIGAAGGAIADGGDGAGKGAGIGAIAGAAAGTLYGLNEENRRTEAARAAYRECMGRRGY